MHVCVDQQVHECVLCVRCAVFFMFTAQAQARLAEETAERAKAEAEERARVALEAAKRAKVSDAFVQCCIVA